VTHAPSPEQGLAAVWPVVRFISCPAAAFVEDRARGHGVGEYVMVHDHSTWVHDTGDDQPAVLMLRGGLMNSETAWRLVPDGAGPARPAIASCSSIGADADGPPTPTSHFTTRGWLSRPTV
jgi:hypothetical protein